VIELRHTKDTREIYNEIYYGDRIHQMDSFFLWMISLLGVKRGQRFLDISTGRGQMVEFAVKAGADAWGLDFSMTACHLAKRRDPHILCADAHSLPFPDDFFDIVTNIGSLEHFEHMDIAVHEMSRVLKPMGSACLVVPNTFGLRWNVNVAWKTGDVDDDGQPLQRYGTRKQWEHILETNGLTVLDVKGYEHERALPRTWRDLRYYLLHPKQLLSMVTIVPLIPVNAAGQFVFICEPTPYCGSGHE
jgi:SAM-dependent methyltransferase